MTDLDGLDFADLVKNVLQWANDRNLIKGSRPKDQFHKLIQECGELSDSLCKGKSTIDDIGDVLVVLIILTEQLELNLTDCLAYAYDEIKDRKGKMVNNIFVKEEDLIGDNQP